MKKEAIRIIKKYPNRRIYDTHDSKYITIGEVREMVVEGIEFKVIDTQTKKDVTRNILLQIILDQESNTNPLFSTDNLQNFIRYYGENPQQGFSSFISQSLEFFQQQQSQLQSNLDKVVEQSPVKVWSDISKQNLDMWQQMQADFLNIISDSKDGAKNKK